MSATHLPITLAAVALVSMLSGQALANEPAASPLPNPPAVNLPTEQTVISAEKQHLFAVLALVQRQLQQLSGKNTDGQDQAALAAYYAQAERTPLWVDAAGINRRAIAAIGEMRNAADWGLNPTNFDLPDARDPLTTADAQAAAEVRISLAALKYARHARGGRIDVSLLGRNVDQKPPILAPNTVLEGIATSPLADAYLRSLHPQHPQFEKLRLALIAARTPPAVATDVPAPGTTQGAAIKLPAGPRIRGGQSHPHVALLRQRLDIATADPAAQRMDDTVQAALRAFQQSKGLDADGVLNNATRSALNGTIKPAVTGDQTQRLLVNMERWRWLPESLGEFHVWDNIPEYRMRVLKNGRTVHAETIIVGKPSTPTPIFSADMKYVIFHPTWGVPDGIKMNEIAPSLRRSTSSFWGGDSDPAILRRHNLIVSQNGRPVNPASVNWQTADIRNFQFTQPPSRSNVLGVVKFRFPNKHDVYMHDTPERELFSRADKAFSHGCMRVQNPRKLAEVLLAEDKGWSAAQVGNAIANGSTQDITLSTQIPVHVTYFTAVVDDDGRLKTFGDIYGHDSRIASALEGKPIRLIAQTDPAVRAEREVRRNQSKRQPSSGGGSIFDLFSGLAGN